MDRFSKFFHQLIREKIGYVYTQRLPPHLQYVATLLRENRKSKNVTDFDGIFNKHVDMTNTRTYNLRQRSHNRTLVAKTSSLTEKDFILRMLYKRIY